MMLGILGSSSIGVIRALNFPGSDSLGERVGILYYFSRVIQILPLAAVESFILLLISSLLLMNSNRRTSRDS